jgi:hypothetical protein
MNIYWLIYLIDRAPAIKDLLDGLSAFILTGSIITGAIYGLSLVIAGAPGGSDTASYVYHTIPMFKIVCCSVVTIILAQLVNLIIPDRAGLILLSGLYLTNKTGVPAHILKIVNKYLTNLEKTLDQGDDE